MTDRGKPKSETTPFERMKELARRIVNVPKSEVTKPKEKEKRRTSTKS